MGMAFPMLNYQYQNSEGKIINSKKLKYNINLHSALY